MSKVLIQNFTHSDNRRLPGFADLILPIQNDLPALVPETVIIAAVSVKADMEPVLVRRIPFLLLYIFERPETTTDMVENTVENDFHTIFMERFTYFSEIFICAQTASMLLKISRVISVIVGFKNRV